MRRDVVRRLASKMTRQRAHLIEEIEAAAGDLESIAAERPTQFEDQAESERETLLIDRLDDRRRREIGEIDLALGCISAGTYGKCARCGAAVSERRLAALPATSVCRRCATVAASVGSS